jgi:predicted sulfurtransferase
MIQEVGNGGETMRQDGMNWLPIILSFGLILMLCAPAHSQDVPRITKEELKAMLGNPDVVVVDVRAGSDWRASTMKIKGAVREEPDKIDSWMSKYGRDKTLVFYCA